jgi:hypothetical protein
MDEKRITENYSNEEADSEAGQAPSEPVPPEPDRVDMTANFIREKTREGRLTSRFSLTRPPLEIPGEELDGVMEELSRRECGKTTAVLEGKKDRFYYCSELMADNYARMLLLAEDADIYQTIAAMVRFESETYPRCTSVTSLTLHPHNLDPEKIKIAVQLMDKRPEYGDIKSLTTSDGQLYFYSDRFLSGDYARALAEYEAVDWKNYP